MHGNTYALCQNSEAHRALWDSQQTGQPQLRSEVRRIGSEPCIHLGGKIGKTSSRTCVARDLYSCRLHTKCTLTRCSGVEHNCLQCNDYAKEPPLQDPKEPVVHVAEAPPPAVAADPHTNGRTEVTMPAGMRLKWTCGVTTVPERRQGLLPKTLESIAAAGFPKPWLFIDGARDPGPWLDLGLEYTLRSTNVQIAGNWHLGALELYHRWPDAEMFAMFQDDLVLCKNVRQYIESQPYPGKGYLNLFTFNSNERDGKGRPRLELLKPGWQESLRWENPANPRQHGRGAIALVFNREALMALLGHKHLTVRAQDRQRGWRFIDGGIVEAMNDVGYREYIHNPSLAFHTGLASTKGSSYRPSLTFPGEEYDALGLLAPKSEEVTK